jgi:hypothetical protein
VPIERMNGKELKYMGYCDFDDPTRAVTTGRHTSIEPWQQAMKRGDVHGRALYGWVWVEYREGDKTRIEEFVLRSQRQWGVARIRAEKEHNGLATMQSYAACCMRLNYVMDDHLKTVRHFRYWCLEYPELAVSMWPWMKDLLAEEALTHRERT